MSEIEESIERVENLYRTVTGKVAPLADETYAPIPAEKDPTVYVQEQMDRLLQVLGEQPASAAAPVWTPPISVWEATNDVIVFVDVPGTARNQIEVSVQQNVLVIAGNRPVPVSNGHRLRFGERPTGQFRRALPLPPGLKASEMTARLRDGVLEVSIPRDVSASGTNPRPVPIA